MRVSLIILLWVIFEELLREIFAHSIFMNTVRDLAGIFDLGKSF